ncbi:DUF3857 domain-containing protein [Flavobacterium arcticum]|uniref:DUF3857 domain-containing protein n=1 Tax=Flavobacterium arcticum TaxID=1784713 RepID=A0A345H9N0_9FLAO|nr:DUF3857 and transglutaminase domain-containing protein [Flavobacterium arcticum]AXG73290.1 DUF3857 domain-containing protein [Flavobacterium arcticum]KAF2513085.1 DUF3857 domain-containing protein [Flavobacterium arcticum]
MKIRLTALFILVLSHITLHAQEFEYELGEVTKEELAQESHPIDKDAPAAILFSKAETYMVYSERDGFDLITEVDMKIKIYNKDGYDWANKSIRFYDPGSNREEVDVSKAYTYNLEDGSIKRTKLKKEGKFTEDVNKYWKREKIVMPDVKEGSIIEYRYKIKSPHISSFPEWRFQEGIPVDHSKYVTKIPEYFTYTPNFRGYHMPKVTQGKANRSISSTSKQRRENQTTTFSTSKIDYIEAITTYEFENLPAMKEEAFVNNIDNYTASIEHEITMIKYPNSPLKSFSATWEDVAKSIYDNDDFGNELKKTGYFEEDVDALLSGLNTPEEKINALYYYVRDNMNWNDYYGYSCQEGVRKAYKEKVGNIADINLMLTSMLRYVGLEANPVLVTTRSSKIALYPNRDAFNYVIAAVQLNNKTILLDATSKSAMPNILPIRAVNWLGRLIKKGGISNEVTLLPTTPSIESISLMATLDTEGKLTGQLKDQYYDYNAYTFRERYNGLSEQSHIEKIEKKYNGITVENYEIANANIFGKPIEERYEFIHTNANIDVIGDKMYISPMLFLTQSENPFKQEKREYPIDFIYPRQDRYMISITLPEGYTVESVPQAVSLAMEQNIGSFNYNVIVNNNRIMLRAMLELNYASIPQDFYPTVKDFFQKMIEKQTEKIIITKNK